MKFQNNWVTTVAAFALVACSKNGATDPAGPDGGGPSPSASQAAPNPTTAAGVVRAYFSSPKCVDRVPYVVNPEGNRPAMLEWYKEKTTCSKKYEVIDDKACAATSVGGDCRVKVIWTDKSASTWLCLERASGGYKIDWRCSIGFNPVTVKAFKAQYAGRKKGQTLAGTFRLRGKMGDYYNYEFLYSKKTHYSVSLSDDSGQSLHGYVKKESPEGQAYFDLLKDGESHAIMAAASYGPRSESSDVVTLGSFSRGWRERPEEFAGAAVDGGTP